MTKNFLNFIFKSLAIGILENKKKETFKKKI